MLAVAGDMAAKGEMRVVGRDGGRRGGEAGGRVFLFFG